ncbi:YibE/F family protein [Anaerosporobacter sp.]|uniref:YibE/F family protein n=1 Tax=Anaerosporobacter sp. TaxID=1872529 RepID=UPI00286ED3B2|nr:YibE/F family protein [Anaerosporobacter sp.]
MNKVSKLKQQLREASPVIASIIILIILILIPTGFEDARIYQGTERCKVEVLSVDNNYIIDTGLVRSGEQTCEIKILEGRFKGRTAQGVNALNGSLESDKIFVAGDKAFVLIDYTDDEIRFVNMIDHYRLDKEIILAAIFVIFLILFAGKTGIRAVLSFVITVLAIWKVMVPEYLRGRNPVIIGLIITIALVIIIIALVYGFNRLTLSAASGSILGVLTTCILGVIFTDMFNIHGAIMSSSESLLYSGYQNLNLTKIFMASIFIGSSGAIMDLAVDITSAINEVVENCPSIRKWEAIRSGFHVGKAAMGTMTTTLLLAYSGGYVALLMVFMAQGTPILNILNYKYVAAEILHTVVGSFGLITVAPFTAVTAGMLLTRKKQKNKEEVSEEIVTE